MLTLTGTVAGAPCDVHGVSVLSAVPASSSLPRFASWSAQVPISLLEAQPACTLDGGASGVEVTAQASIIQDPGTADIDIVSSPNPTCVAMSLPAPSSECTIVDCTPPTIGTLRGVQCLLPTSGGAPSSIAIYLPAGAVSRTITWRSAAGIASILSPSNVIYPASAGAGADLDAAAEVSDAALKASAPSCAAQCASASTLCVGGTSTALISGTGEALSGFDLITVTVDGYVSPVASVTVAVQGPPKITIVPPEVTTGGTTFITVANPMRFTIGCTVTIPTGVTVSIVDGAAGTANCTADAGGPDTDASTSQSCQLVTASFSTPLLTYALSSSVVADAQSGENGGVTSLICVDEFSQVSTALIPTSAPTNSGDDVADATAD